MLWFFLLILIEIHTSNKHPLSFLMPTISMWGVWFLFIDWNSNLDYSGLLQLFSRQTAPFGNPNLNLLPNSRTLLAWSTPFLPPSCWCLRWISPLISAFLATFPSLYNFYRAPITRIKRHAGYISCRLCTTCIRSACCWRPLNLFLNVL